jgi:HK97 family phage major capsid protein
MADTFAGVQGIERGDVASLVPEQVSSAMLESLSTSSAILALATRIPISRRQVRFPILAALPAAYFVDGDLGLKQTTKVEWDNKYMNVEELAVIVPIPEAVLDDSGFDMFGAIRPLLEGAIARKFDAAVVFGEDKPGSWDDDLVSIAEGAGNTVVLGTATPAEGGIAEDFNQLFGLIEDGGYDVNGVIAAPRLKTRIRSARDTTGQALADLSTGTILGARLNTAAMPGMWAGRNVQAIAGDFSKVVVGVRQDITYKVLDQAVLTDENGVVILNLAQQDAVALRVVFRVGYAVANPINYVNADTADPHGVPTSAAFGVALDH